MANEPQVHFIDPDDLEQVYARRLKFVDEAHGHAAAYDTAIIVAGYGAFFALWAGVADDVTKVARNASAGLMGLSLLLFIGWTIGAMLTRHRYDMEFAKAMRRGQGLLDEMNAWDVVEQKRIKAMMSLQRWWPAIFWPSVIAGVAGASC